MRNILIVFILTFTSFAFAVSEADPQDIVMKTRMDKQSSATLIERIRTALINNHLGDPYNQRFPTPIVVDFNEMVDDLPAGTQSWIKEFQSILNLRLFESSYKLKVQNFSYSITQFSSDLQPLNSGLNRIEYVSVNAVEGLKISAEKIAFQVELQRTQSGAPIKFDIELVQPEFIIDPALVFELPMGWNSALMPDSLMVSLHTIDLSKIFGKIVENPSLVTFQVKDLIMPNVSIRIGNREVAFDREKLKRFMNNRKDDMKMAIIDLLSSRMQERFSNIIADRPQEVFLPRHFSIAAAVSPVFDLRSMDAYKETKLIDVRIDGHFCADKNDLAYNLCRTNQLQAKLRREIKAEVFDQSMAELDLAFSEKRANVAVSISEHYLNQGIAAAAAANLIDLAGEDFVLGSEKAFMLAEEKGESFNIYLDIIYKLSSTERVMVGRSELRFPVKLAIGIKIVDVNGYPRFQIKVLGNKTDNAMILRGLPQYQLPTNVGSVRFQKKVLNQIADRMRPFAKKTLVDIELKEFKGTYLEQLNFISDGKGRANAILFMNAKKF